MVMSHDQKPRYISFWSSWLNECRGAIDSTVSFIWWWHWCQWCVTWPKVMLHLIFNYLDLTNAIVSLMLSASCDADTSANDNTWPKSHATHHLYCLYLTSAVDSLTMPLAGHDTNVGTNGVTWPKMSCCTLFKSSWLNECNAAIDNNISITWCWCQCQHCKMP